jgi:hypothetical protein
MSLFRCPSPKLTSEQLLQTDFKDSCDRVSREVAKAKEAKQDSVTIRFSTNQIRNHFLQHLEAVLKDQIEGKYSFNDIVKRSGDFKEACFYEAGFEDVLALLSHFICNENREMYKR